MDTRAVHHVLIAFDNPDTPALVLERPELDRLLANPMLRNVADRWLKNRTEGHRATTEKTAAAR